ncbi:MAG: hypothetical protein PHX62_09360 [Bacilli bacterium]|nr:hypothetical protein [Bacilli bacterium]
MNNNLLEIFFDNIYESEIDSRMFYYDYVFPMEQMIEYLEGLISINYQEFLDFLFFNQRISPITSNNVFQFSCLEDATSNICTKILQQGDLGLNYVEIGKILLDKDEIKRNEVALRKYGENHSKTAKELSLVQFKTHYCFLSCVGKAFIKLDDEKRSRILSRLSLRSPLIKNLLLKSLNGRVFLKEELVFLSDTTIKRRLPNIRRIISLLNDNGDLDVSQIIENIVYI